jgi:hypothetical protein
MHDCPSCKCEAGMSNAQKEYFHATDNMLDVWVPAGYGSETPFIKDGKLYLYVWNPALGKHGVLDMDTDIVIDDKEFYNV